MLSGGKSSRVKNKAAAEVQITAEQILHEAQARQEEEWTPPTQKIHDFEELQDYRLRKRKEFEDNIRKARTHTPHWTKYAKWEESQGDYTRARSVYERALDVEYKNPIVWLKYAEMEMTAKNVNHARNIWDRAVTLLPRVDQFWLKYSYMEDIMGNYAAARQIFERWMEWQPSEHAWRTYINFEIRHREWDRCRDIFNRFVQCHPTVKTWLRYAKFEIAHGDTTKAREVFQTALEFLGEDANDEKLFIEFARFEERCKEYDRARAIYKYALDHVPKHRAQELYKRFIAFEKQYGDKSGIEDVIVNKRRFQYEEEVKANPRNYDAWFDYARLEEANGEPGKVRELYERAVSNVPPGNHKRFWRRYIYLWINYALYEELDANNIDRTREVYRACLRLIPHKAFSFSKIWILFANFEIRQRNLSAARKVYGQAIGVAPKQKIFESYIALELKLGEIDRCRQLYTRWLEIEPSSCAAWCKFAELEASLDEGERVRKLYEVAIDQPSLDMPELVWKSFIDFEIEEEEYENARALYNSLLDRTQHVKVWCSFANFEDSIGEVERAREVYRRAYKELKTADDKEERAILAEAWREFEVAHGDTEQIASVKKLQPRTVIRQRQLYGEDGTPAGMEEYHDYVFPDEENQTASMKILEMAHKWKKRKLAEESTKTALSGVDDA